MTRGGPDLHDMGYQFARKKLMLSLSIRLRCCLSNRRRVNISAPCYDPTPPRILGQGICSGEWINNITMYDTLRVPHVPAGECESGSFGVVLCLGSDPRCARRRAGLPLGE